MKLAVVQTILKFKSHKKWIAVYQHYPEHIWWMGKIKFLSIPTIIYLQLQPNQVSATPVAIVVKYLKQPIISLVNMDIRSCCYRIILLIECYITQISRSRKCREMIQIKNLSFPSKLKVGMAWVEIRILWFMKGRWTVDFSINPELSTILLHLPQPLLCYIINSSSNRVIKTIPIIVSRRLVL